MFDTLNTHWIRLHRLIILSIAIASPQLSVAAEAESNAGYEELEWVDLIPADDLAALLNPPESLDNIADGSAEDDINSFGNSPGSEQEARYGAALRSTRIIAEYDGKAIRIPGFIVPVEFDDDQSIIGFFLVPYFGACLHLPPPPPNQIIYATYEPGFNLDVLYDPFWLEGTLHTQLTDNGLATAAYVMRVDRMEDYED